MPVIPPVKLRNFNCQISNRNLKRISNPVLRGSNMAFFFACSQATCPRKREPPESFAPGRGAKKMRLFQDALNILNTVYIKHTKEREAAD